MSRSKQPNKAEYEYWVVNADQTAHPDDTTPTVVATANHYAAEGWRVAGIISSPGPHYYHQLLLERKIPKENPYHQWDNRDSWISWELEHNPTENPYDPGREWSMWHRWEEGKVRRGR